MTDSEIELVRAVTRADVARLAGTSVAVVSYVVNDGPRPVADSTRQRVQAAIDELHYHPNGVARSLRRQRTDLIGLIVPDIANPYFSELASAIEEAAAEAGLLVLFASTAGVAQREWEFVRAFASQQVGGVILVSSGRSEWSEQAVPFGIPTVSLDRALPSSPSTSITVENRRGGLLATRHLIWHGHRRIGHIAGPENVLEMTERRQGWRDALEADGVPFDERRSIVSPLDRLGGFHVAERLLDQHDVTAIFAASDEQAIGAMKAVSARGLRVGEDVAIIGFDGIAEGAFTTPGLSTVSQPIRRMGSDAVTLLLQTVSSGSPAPSIEHELSLLVRGSCGCSQEQHRPTPRI